MNSRARASTLFFPVLRVKIDSASAHAAFRGRGAAAAAAPLQSGRGNLPSGGNANYCGWAFADSVLHRLAPLWIGARGLEFNWEYIFRGLEANANLVMTLSLAALGSLMCLRKNKPRTLIPIIYACALLLETMPSITRLSHYHAAVTLKGNNYHAPTYVDILISFFKKQFLVMPVNLAGFALMYAQNLSRSDIQFLTI
ncbi:uncharacterized protein LOC123441784 [Hordeum vulgare subsp. vulgare]|uniref:uncharacterized protein LOC123441784 n=1 Tax=Hordeum vulgare subsp. vulgare TaxID=112509 RepID=UPI001D1A43AA|nr:uncharacterized protein LOC123441784 [Hordeum vulgare subsp. vulgare]